MNFTFQCISCDIYPVDEQTLQAALGPQLRTRLEQKLATPRRKSKVVEARVDFGKTGCFNCRPGVPHRLVLKICESPVISESC